MRIMDHPDFYLASGETVPLLAPRACFIEERLVAAENRDDYLRVQIDPPIVGQHLGLGDHDIEEVVLATRHAETTLHPISEWPTMVYICDIVNEKIRGSGHASAKDLRILLIGDLHRTSQDADRWIGYHGSRM